MVATRRGGRVCSPSKTNSNESAEDVAIPASTRQTRRTAAQSEETSDSQHEVLPEATGRRKSRMSKQTGCFNQVDSTHEADVSESDSCCSALSDTDAIPNAQSARRGRRAAGMDQPNSKEDEVPKGDTCFSSVSREQNAYRVTRSLRKPCSSVLPASKAMDSLTRVTRSTQRAAMSSNRGSSKSQSEEAELSDSESCASGPQTSTVRRATRARKGRLVEAIPMHLEETGSNSPVQHGGNESQGNALDSQTYDSEGFESGPCMTPRRSTRRRKGPKQTGATVTDSESDLTDAYTPLGSPLLALGRGTPCSSRTGSSSSSRATPATRMTAKALDILVVKALTRSSTVTVSRIAEESVVSEDQNLEDTVNADPDSSVIDMCEEDRTLTLGDEDVVIFDPETSQGAAPEETESPTATEDAEMPEATCVQQGSKKTTGEEVEMHTSVPTLENIPQGDVKADVKVNLTVCESADAEIAEATCVPAVETEDQQREPSTKDGADVDAPATLEKETIMPADSRVLPHQPVTVTTCEHEMAPVIMVSDEEKEEAPIDVDVNSHPNPPSEAGSQKCMAGPIKEAIDVSGSLVTAVQKADQKADQDRAPHTTEAIVVTSSQNLNVCLSAAVKPRDSILVQKTGFISLLESSEDESMEHSEEEGDDGERQDSDGKGEAVRVEDEASPSVATHSLASDGGLFVIDTHPGLQSGGQYYVDEQGKSSRDGEMAAVEEGDEEEFVDEEGSDDDEDSKVLFTCRNPQLKELSSCIDPGLRVKELGGLYINFDGSKSKTVSNSLRKLKEQKNQDELMKKSVIGPEFEKTDAVPPYKESKHAAKLKRKEEREKTSGAGWFNMRAPEMTEELKGDLKALKMRGAMDPKRFYKKNDRDGFPKYFQVATVVDNPVDFYHSRVPKKERKRTIVEELLADAEFRHTNKKKFQHIMAEKAAMAAGRKNKNNKKNKFRK
ncbi:deoxynucleotidyltransferase terminal-interacting protein 2 [Esox lucius]|uniref:Fcf2 pre-rRNA processing C-terminal domain-containing protein n=1 Tax=Esox lucius TaxID=8010 RepID=A0A3P8XUE7_ESOLU|nr:deoxynucleotidyltransferase terminal-interacting protein 2 [Esox lucius]